MSDSLMNRKAGRYVLKLSSGMFQRSASAMTGSQQNILPPLKRTAENSSAHKGKTAGAARKAWIGTGDYAVSRAETLTEAAETDEYHEGLEP